MILAAVLAVTTVLFPLIVYLHMKKKLRETVLFLTGEYHRVSVEKDKLKRFIGRIRR